MQEARLSKEEEMQLGALAASGDVTARNKLIEAHMWVPRIHSRIMRKRFPGVSIDDLYGAACLGLCIAATTYKPQPDARFYAYARAFVDGHLFAYLKHKKRQTSLELPAAITLESGEEIENEGKAPPDQEIAADYAFSRKILDNFSAKLSPEDRRLFNSVKDDEHLGDFTAKSGVTKQAISLRRIKLYKRLKFVLLTHKIRTLDDLL